MAREKITEQNLNRMAVRGAKVKRSSPVPSAAEVVASEGSRAPVPSRPELASSPPPPVDNSIPFASMAASQGVINEQLGRVVEQNTKVIAGLQADLQTQILNKDKRKPWRAIVKRTPQKLIHYVDLIPLEPQTEIVK